MDRKIKITTEYDLKQPVNELAKLSKVSDDAAKEVSKIQKALRETSDTAERSKLRETLTAAKQAASEAKKEMENLQKATDINKMTFGQLSNFVKKLEKDIYGVKQGTEDYARIQKQLEPAAKLYNQQRMEIDALKKATVQNTSVMGTFKEVLLGTFAGNALFAGINMLKDAVVNIFGTSVNEFRAFETSAQDLKAEVELTQLQFASLKKEGREVGPVFGKTAKEMLDAYNVVGSGKSELTKTEKGLQDVTQAALKLSIAGGVDLKDSAETVTNSLNQYGGSSRDAAKYVDIMATGSKVGAAKIGELTASLKYAGPVASALNISFAQTNGLLQVMSTNGIKGEQAGTALRGTLLHLSKQSDSTINPSIVGTSKAFENLAAKNLTASQMAKLVGTENVTAALSLTANVPKIKDFTSAIEKGGGAQDMFAEKTKTLNFQIQQGKAFLINQALAFGEFLAPAISKAITVGIAFIKILLDLPKFLNDNKVTIFGLIAAIIAFDLSLAKSNISLLANTAATKAKAIWDKAVTITTNLFTIAQNGLNMAMRANPIGLVVSALIALATVIYTAYQNSQTFRAAVSGLMNVIKAAVTIFIDFQKAIFSLDFKGAINSITSSLGKMKDAYQKGYSETIRAESTKNTKQITKDQEAQAAASKESTGNQLADVNALDEAKKKAAEKNKERREKEAKANEEALSKIRSLEEDHYIAEIRRKDGELAAEIAKLNKEQALAVLAVKNSVASKANKDRQIELLELQHNDKLIDLKAKAQQEESELVQKWLETENSKKLRSIQTQYNKELAEARKLVTDKTKLADIEKKLADWLSDERQKITEAERKAELKAFTEAANKRLADEKSILTQQKEANQLILDWKELSSRNNSRELLKIAKARADQELSYRQDLLALERKSEQIKAKEEISDAEALAKELLKIDRKYAIDNEKLIYEHEKKKTEIANKAQDDRAAKVKAVSDGFSAMMKGDMQGMQQAITGMLGPAGAAAQKASDMVQKAVDDVANAVKSAITFINDMIQLQTTTKLNLLERSYKKESDMLNKSLADANAAYEKSLAERELLLDNFSNNVERINAEEKQKISNLEDLYSQIKKEGAEFDVKAAIELSAEEREEKIRDIKITAEEQIRSANNTREEQIIAAEAYLKAFATATHERTDISLEEKANLILDAQETAKSKIQTAKDTAAAAIAESGREKDQKILDASNEHNHKIDLIQAAIAQESAKVDTILQNANREKFEKIKMAEDEKNAKLKIVEEENAKRLLAKEKLDRELKAAEKKYRQEKYELELNAFKAQQKADIQMAKVNAAQAFIKAMTGGIFPLNLVMATLTAAQTDKQIDYIKSQIPPEPPTFSQGTRQVVPGVGGVPSGPAHGSSYGRGGIALIHRHTGVEVGEMEGDEAIISRRQTEANMPLIDLMLAKARRGDNSPIMPGMFRFGGFLLPQIPKDMYLFGSKKRKAAEAMAQAEATAALVAQNDGDSGASAAYNAAQVQIKAQLEILESIQSAIEEGNESVLSALKSIDKNTADTVSAARDTSAAVRETDSRGSLNAMLDKLRSFK